MLEDNFSQFLAHSIDYPNEILWSLIEYFVERGRTMCVHYDDIIILRMLLVLLKV